MPILRQLADVPDSEWQHFERSLRLVALEPGDALTRAGDVADRIGVVVSGLLRKAAVTARGRTVVRDFAGPGSVVGAYVSLLTGEPSYLTVEALEPSQLYVLPWAALQASYERHVCWQIIGRRFAEMTLVERESRAHDLLTLSATERFERFCETHRTLLPRLKSYDIASYLGITPVSLSRLRARATGAARQAARKTEGA